MSSTALPRPSLSPLDTTLDWTDSLYHYVKNRILIQNPMRNFGGIIDALDWPLPEAKQETFYMIVTSANSNRGQGVGTNPWFSSLYGQQVQWAWNIIGDDIPNDAYARNRGNKYRKNITMREELRYGHYPGFCEKLKFSVENNQTNTHSYTPAEFIWYEKPAFSTRFDRNSGILFGSALTKITSFTPEIQE